MLELCNAVQNFSYCGFFFYGTGCPRRTIIKSVRHKRRFCADLIFCDNVRKPFIIFKVKSVKDFCHQIKSFGQLFFEEFHLKAEPVAVKEIFGFVVLHELQRFFCFNKRAWHKRACLVAHNFVSFSQTVRPMLSVPAQFKQRIGEQRHINVIIWFKQVKRKENLKIDYAVCVDFICKKRDAVFKFLNFSLFSRQFFRQLAELKIRNRSQCFRRILRILIFVKRVKLFFKRSFVCCLCFFCNKLRFFGVAFLQKFFGRLNNCTYVVFADKVFFH